MVAIHHILGQLALSFKVVWDGGNLCIVGCTNSGGKHKGVSVLEPSTPGRQAWIARINRKERIPTLSTAVCSDHFLSGKGIWEYYIIDVYHTIHFIQESHRNSIAAITQIGFHIKEWFTP